MCEAETKELGTLLFVVGTLNTPQDMEVKLNAGDWMMMRNSDVIK